jgi:Skp family chaperone for outer membrane proteins
MKKLFFFLAAILALQAATLSAWAEDTSSSASAAASGQHALKLAVVDVQEVLRASKAATKWREQLEAQKTALQKDLSKEESGLRDQEQELAGKRSVLKAEAFEQKRKEFQEKVAAFQKKVQDKSRDLDQKFANGNNQVRKAMLESVAEISEKNGFSMVFSRADLLIFDKTLDVTDQVVKAIDQKLPEIKPESTTTAAPASAPAKK